MAKQKQISQTVQTPNKWRVRIGLGIVLCVGIAIGWIINHDNGAVSPREFADAEIKIESTIPVGDTCAQIEKLLNTRIAESGLDQDSTIPDVHLARAEIFATIAKRGCAENSDRYKALAVHEIQIVRALQDDENFDEYQVRNMVDTYQKLDMAAEAKQFVDTMKRITGPAIEFMNEVQKIISEE